jgi:hypothetical protein
MKWQIASSTAKQEIYELWRKEKKLLTLEFHPSTNSARIEYAGEKRVFLVRKEGFLKNKTVLCNEYGIRLGHLVNDSKEHYIELNGERFFYAIDNGEKTKLIIYKEAKSNPLVVCDIDINKNSNSLFVSKGVTPDAKVYSSLLLALGWYMILPVAKESKLELAV